MAIEVAERNNSGVLDDLGARELLYNVSGTADRPAALAALRAEAPLTYEGTPRRRCRLETVWVDSLSDDGLFNGSAEYSSDEDQDQSPPPLAEGEERWSFNTQGGTAHITQGLKMGEPEVFERRYPAPGKQYRDYRGAIRVTRDGIEGCDVPTGVLMLECTTVLAAEDVTDDFRRALAALTPCTNDTPWHGFAPGEVCFLGVRGGERADGKHELTFGFWAQLNVEGQTIGAIGTGTSVPINKTGWEYLWVEYEEYYNSTQKLMEKRPAVAYVDKVVEYGDFSNIPVSSE